MFMVQYVMIFRYSSEMSTPFILRGTLNLNLNEEASSFVYPFHLLKIHVLDKKIRLLLNHFLHFSMR